MKQMTIIIYSVVDDRGRTLFKVRMTEPVERTAYRIEAEQVLHYVRWRATNAVRGAPLIAKL